MIFEINFYISEFYSDKKLLKIHLFFIDTNREELVRKNMEPNSHYKYVLSHARLFATPWTVARQAPLSRKFCRKEKWRGLPFPTPGDLPDPRIKLLSLALAGKFFTTSATWEAFSFGDTNLKIEDMHYTSSTIILTKTFDKQKGKLDMTWSRAV